MKLFDLYNEVLILMADAAHEGLWVLSHYTEIPKNQLLLWKDNEISDDTAQLVKEALKRRLAGEPLQYILGSQAFMNLELLVTPDVLIPRWDSEIVVEKAISLVADLANSCGENLRIADLCTGSGAYALSLKDAFPKAEVWAFDISTAALAVAKSNAKKYDFDVNFVQGDFLQAFPENVEFDLIASNPPYIPVAATLPSDVLLEPHLALFGGDDGLDFYKRFATEQVAKHLKSGGYLIVEIGCEQAEAVSEIFAAAGLCDIDFGKDYNGLNRWVVGRKL